MSGFTCTRPRANASSAVSNGPQPRPHQFERQGQSRLGAGAFDDDVRGSGGRPVAEQ